MDALLQEIESNIRLSVHTFIRNVSGKHGIDFDDLINMWENSGTDQVIQSPSKIVAKPKIKKVSPCVDSDSDEENQSQSAVGKKAVQKTAPSSSDGCPYIYTKGEKEGQSCGIKPKGSVIYCTRHKKYEGQEPKQKKIVPSAKKSIAGIAPSRVTPIPAKEVNTVLRKNKAIDKLWHSATGMVFKSAKERVVIGKCVDDTLFPLEKEDVDVCMAHSFAYDESWKGDDVVEEKKTFLPVKKIESKDVAKKSISEAITEANIKAADVEAILCELQIPKKKATSISDEDLFEDDLVEEDEDLLEEEDE